MLKVAEEFDFFFFCELFESFLVWAVVDFDCLVVVSYYSYVDSFVGDWVWYELYDGVVCAFVFCFFVIGYFLWLYGCFFCV